MTRYSERSKFHPTSTPLSADLKKKIISESRVRKQGFNPQLQNGKNPEFNHQPLAKANYFSSNHDDSGFMEREEDTPPISYLHGSHIRFNDGMSGEHHPPRTTPLAVNQYPYLTSSYGCPPPHGFSIDHFMTKFQHNHMDRRFSLPYTHKIVNPEGIEAARAWFNAYSLNDYYSEMLRMEEELHPSDIFKCQNNITPADRAKLLHWIIRVCCSNVFECMHQEALHLCVSIIDYYLAGHSNVLTTELQLLGITSLLIASKQLLYDPPEIRQLLRLCENIYRSQDVKSCERKILKAMKWRLHRPTTHTFADFYAAYLLYQVNWMPEETKRIVRHLSVARYCLDFGLLSTPFCSFYPSVRAKAAFNLAAIMLNEKCIGMPTSATDKNYIIPCMDSLREVMINENHQQLNIHENIFINYSYS